MRVNRRVALGTVIAAACAIGASAPMLLSAATGESPSAGSARTASPSPSPTAGPAFLLPNLRSLPAENVHIARTGDRRVLRFAGVLSNLGPGPLEVAPRESRTCPPGQRHADQVLYHDADRDGRFSRAVDRRVSLRPAGCMLDHPTHKHWHFDATASYVLSTPGATAPVAAKEKVSFCLRDNRPVVDSPLRRHYGDCTRDRVQGITAGWADVYRASLPGQALELPAGLTDGVYCLTVTADPMRLLHEAREDDNASVRALRITGPDVTGAPPAACGEAA
jgi:hypothetical protein